MDKGKNVFKHNMKINTICISIVVCMLICISLFVVNLNYQDEETMLSKYKVLGKDAISSLADSSTALDVQLDYSENNVWKKSHTVKIKVTGENVNPEFKYRWINQVTEEVIQGTGTLTAVEGEENTYQATVTKTGINGIYNFIYEVKDTSGNTTMDFGGSFNFDNMLSPNEMGRILVEKYSKDGTDEGEYIVWIPASYGPGYYTTGCNSKEVNDHREYDCPYTMDNLSISVGNGSGYIYDSGHDKTTYQVYKKVGSEFIVVGEQTTATTNLYDNGTYKVLVTSKDKLGNARTDVYLLHIGESNITFGTNGGTGTSASTTVTVSDDTHDYSEISYVWLKKGQEPDENTEWTTTESGETVTFSPNEKGTFNLWVKTVDSLGNVNITKSGDFVINGVIDNIGNITFRKTDENGDVIEPEGETIVSKDNVWIKISQGNDRLGTVKTTYKVTDSNGIVVGGGTSESTTLTEEGVYTLTLTGKRTNDNLTETKDYTITVDKSKPVVTFTPASEANAQVGKLTVNVADNNGVAIAQTGVDSSSLRYYWVQGFYEPENFDEAKDEYRGRFTNGSTLSAPDGSGIWVLWIYAKDNAGNIVKDKSIERENNNQTVSDQEVTKAGRLQIVKVDGESEEGYQAAVTEKYTLNGEAIENVEQEEAEYTNQNVKLKLIPAYDKETGIAQNSYTITRDGTTVKINDETTFTGEVTLVPHGTYIATVTTKDNAGNEKVREYTIKIDKNGPQIAFTPNGNTTFAKEHEVSVSITDDKSTTEIGTINESATKYVWVGYNPEKFENISDGIEKIKEIIDNDEISLKELLATMTTEDVKNSLENFGIYVIPTTASESLKTPEGKTGKFVLFVYAEDSLGNASEFDKAYSKEFSIDNTNPTVPSVRAVRLQKVGTKDQYVPYYGEKVNVDVTVIAENSKSLSGVDRYEYSFTTDEGETWSEWTSATKTEDDKIWGEITIKDHGKTIVKFRSVAELIDGELISDETEEFVVVIDKKGPEITYKNETNEENGSEEAIENIKVKVTATDEGEIQVNPNTLAYVWVKYDNTADFETSSKQEEFLKEKLEDGTKFTNGEYIASPKNAEGIYSLVVCAEDMLGNATYSTSNYYKFTKDKEGPEVTFANTENGENGSKNATEKIKVRVTVADESGVAEDTLKYSWLKFNKIDNYIDFIDSTQSPNATNEVEGKTTFSNGEPIASPDGAEGIYCLFIYAEDKQGNVTKAYSDYYILSLEPEESSIYELDGKSIKRVIPGTTVDEFISQVSSLIRGTEYKVYDKNEKEIKEDELVTTASTLEVDGKLYTIVVIGDLNGDGKLNGVDIVRIRFYRVGKYSLSGAYLKAADINNDGKVNGVDLLKMRQLNVGIAHFTE